VTWPKNKVVAGAIVVSLVVGGGVWIYALFFANPKPTDSLSNPAFATTAQPICQAMIQHLKDDDLVDKVASSPAERADLAERADTIVAAMIDDLATHTPTTADDGRIVTAWLGDWRAWLEDRAKWVAQLRAGKDGPFNERQRETGEPNTQALDKLANNNGMSACTIPAGV
jgi:hypothetical protein